MRDQMTRLMRAALAAGLSGCIVLLASGSASAATTIGQNGASGPGTCGAGNTFIQTGTATGVPSYAVPAGGGVITSWSFQAGSTTDEHDKLKIVRSNGTANQFVVVGESALEAMTPSTLNTFQLRMPVQAGDLIGLFTVDGNDCVVSTHTPGNTDLYIAGADPAPGTTFTGIPESSSGEAYNVSAVVEPDADNDGWGDDTQDKCVGATGSVQGCPKADLSITETVNASAVVRDGTVTYRMTAQNSGPDPAPHTVVTDSLPPGATVVSATASSGSCVAAAAVSCDVGTLASGATAMVTLVVKMSRVGAATDTATVGSATLDSAAARASGAGDTNAANNSASTTTAVVTVPSTAVGGIANATQSHTRWREPRRPKLATVSKKQPPVGTTFELTLRGRASVRFDFTQRVAGRRVRGKCVARTNANKHKSACARTVSRGSLSFAGRAGLTTVDFQGRVSASKKLNPGTYTVVITATTPGVGSTFKRLTFTIVT
jgi:uncharacterized repeat protein (TIGR01451 family)